MVNMKLHQPFWRKFANIIYTHYYNMKCKQKGKMSKDDIKDLDAIRRENCKLRATVHRMKDELKYMESEKSYNINNFPLQKQQSFGSNATTHNNYYINTINYNNIINNHSHMNLQNNNHKWYPLSQGRAQTPSDETPPAPPRSGSGGSGLSTKKTSPGMTLNY